jgi:hypothetical protein
MKRIKYFFVACLVLAFANIAFAEQELTLTWDPGIEQDLLGYKIYQTYISLDGLTDVTTVIYDGTQNSYEFTVTVPGHYHYVATAYNDDGESDFSNEEYFLYDIPAAPVANAGQSPVNVDAGGVVLLNGTASTGANMTYLWSKLTGPAYTINNSTSVVANFTALSVAAKTLTIIRLRVRDEHNRDAYATKIVYINPVSSNAPPVSSAGPDRMVARNATITLDGSASTDDKGIVSHGWKQIYPPTAAIFSTEEQPTVTVGIGIFIFSNTVSDFEGETDADTVVIRALL